ncbi:transposase [Rhodococcus tukisamuensis]|uniref:Transposase n=1 Tax=Rhodococcus tukisamuensis TaxID=168276 RepID=A0A1G6T440_9NOCA|nr:transposase [Rhodococcus tukisamuensis]
MPKAFPEEFRRDVIAVARKGEALLRQIAKDFGISEGRLHPWLKIANRDDGIETGSKPSNSDESAELRGARKRIKLLEQEPESASTSAHNTHSVIMAPNSGDKLI